MKQGLLFEGKNVLLVEDELVGGATINRARLLGSLKCDHTEPST